MSTCSANTTSLASRRTLIAQAGLLATIGATTATPFAPAIVHDSDDHLLALGREWAAAAALAAEADRHLAVVSKRYEQIVPPEPEEIVWRETDVNLFGEDFRGREEKLRGSATGRWLFDGPEHVNMLELVLVELRSVDVPTASRTKVARGVARIDESACWLSCGMEEAERASDAAHDRCADLRWEIVQLPATTLAGVLLKARIAASCFGDTLDEADAAIEALIDDASGPSMSLSITRDLARMAANRDNVGGHDA